MTDDVSHLPKPEREVPGPQGADLEQVKLTVTEVPVSHVVTSDGRTIEAVPTFRAWVLEARRSGKLEAAQAFGSQAEAIEIGESLMADLQARGEFHPYIGPEA